MRIHLSPIRLGKVGKHRLDARGWRCGDSRTLCWGPRHPLDDIHWSDTVPLWPSPWKETVSFEDPLHGACPGHRAVKIFAGSQAAVDLGVVGPWEGRSLAQLPGPCPRQGHMCGPVGGSLGTGEGDSPSLSSVPTPEGAPLGGAYRSLSFSLLFSIVGFVFVFSGPRVTKYKVCHFSDSTSELNALIYYILKWHCMI